MTVKRVLGALDDEAPFASVVGMIAIAFVYLALAPQHWLRACALIAGALVIGGVLRAVLPARRAGLLAVRSRWLDVLCYVTLGVLVVITGLLLPR